MRITPLGHYGPWSIQWPRGVLWPGYCLLDVSYSQTAIIHAAYFRRVVKEEGGGGLQIG